MDKVEMPGWWLEVNGRRFMIATVVVAAVAAGCVGDEDPAVETSTSGVSVASPTVTTTSASPAPSTTGATVPTTTSTSTTTVPAATRPTVQEPALLLAGPTGIALLHAGGRIESLWSEAGAAAAYPDHDGGVIFQPSGWPRADIYRLRPGIDEPEVLVASAPMDDVSLHNLELIGGHPTMVYTVDRIPCNPSVDAECSMDDAYFNMEVDVVYADLDTGATRVSPAIGGWESIPRSTSVGGPLVVHDWADDAGWGHARMFDLDGNHLPWPAEPCEWNVWSCTTAALSPTGDHLIVVGDPCREATTTCLAELRIYDIDTGAETVGTELGTDYRASIDVDAERIVVAAAGRATILDYEGATAWEANLSGFEVSSVAIWPVDPPLLEILDPNHGATVTTRQYTFRGTTCPGCAVSVGGKYDATVTAGGTWTLELLLEPGPNSTTFVATDPETGLETSQRIRVHYEPPLTLRPDGLGSIDFGTLADDAIGQLAAALGPPTADDSLIWDDPGDRVCNWVLCYEFARWVSWGNAGLSVVISDLWTRPGGGWSRVPPSFVGYFHGGSDSEAPAVTLLTPEGIGIGSTFAELDAAYGEALNAEMRDCPERPSFQTKLGEHSMQYPGSGYWGYLSDGPILPSSTVLSIEAGGPPIC